MLLWKSNRYRQMGTRHQENMMALLRLPWFKTVHCSSISSKFRRSCLKLFRFWRKFFRCCLKCWKDEQFWITSRANSYLFGSYFLFACWKAPWWCRVRVCHGPCGPLTRQRFGVHRSPRASLRLIPCVSTSILGKYHGHRQMEIEPHQTILVACWLPFGHFLGSLGHSLVTFRRPKTGYPFDDTNVTQKDPSTHIVYEPLCAASHVCHRCIICQIADMACNIRAFRLRCDTWDVVNIITHYISSHRVFNRTKTQPNTKGLDNMPKKLKPRLELAKTLMKAWSCQTMLEHVIQKL